MENKKGNIQLIASAIMMVGAVILFVIFYNIRNPTYTNISPENYFSSNISWNTSVQQFQGLQTFTILNTSSMLPTIPYNSTILVLPMNKISSIQKGDMIAFYYSAAEMPAVHRVVDIQADGYLTKGDNNKQADNLLVTQDQIIGKVVGVLY